MARMRALEYGREMIRATGNGITALVDHRGDLRHQLPQFEQAVLSGTVQPRRGWTPFAATGTAFWVGGMALALGGLLRRGPTRHNSISQSSCPTQRARRLLERNTHLRLPAPAK